MIKSILMILMKILKKENMQQSMLKCGRFEYEEIPNSKTLSNTVVT